MLTDWTRMVDGLAATAKSLQLCPTLCDPIDGSPPGSPVLEILQVRTLEWVAILDAPIGFALLALRSCLLRPAYCTLPSPSSQLQSISMVSITSPPTCRRFLSCSLYERMHSLCSSTSSRGSSVLPRSAGQHRGGE